MRTEPITEEDRELIGAAEAVLEGCHVPGRHRCAVAMRSSADQVYTGINLISNGVTDIHAEPIALAKAIEAGDPDIETCVAVIYEDDDGSRPVQVVAPCGVCRELLHAFVPGVSLLIPSADSPVRVSLSQLLPVSPY